MIQSITIRRFKRFGDLTFQLNGRHVVLAGPNNMGKTTILQAVAAWSLAFTRWKDLKDFQRHGGYYTKAPIARQAFSAVPLRRYDYTRFNEIAAAMLPDEIHPEVSAKLNQIMEAFGL
jgi:predicted ATP-dependent endonuclease of OLD family